jgi:hypothetical protein
MRLIDADAFKEYLNKKFISNDSMVIFLYQLIDEQPTAYDVDKVIKDILNIDVDLYNNNVRQGVITSLPDYRRKIINIASGGGIDE